jgi:hypothetical protein
MVLRHFEAVGHQEDGAYYFQYAVPTSLTGCVPSEVLTRMRLAEAEVPPTGRPTLHDYL